MQLSLHLVAYFGEEEQSNKRDFFYREGKKALSMAWSPFVNGYRHLCMQLLLNVPSASAAYM